MREEDAIRVLEARVEAGAVLKVAGQGDFRAVKKLLGECLDAEIPTMLGPCTVGG